MVVRMVILHQKFFIYILYINKYGQDFIRLMSMQREIQIIGKCRSSRLNSVFQALQFQQFLKLKRQLF